MSDMVDISFILKEQCAVYALYHENECVYVGQSKKVVRRIQKHKSNGLIPFNRVLVRFCEEHELDQLEFQFIRSLQPRTNITNIGPELDNTIDLVGLGLLKAKPSS
jgi:hypothetical protein